MDERSGVEGRMRSRGVAPDAPRVASRVFGLLSMDLRCSIETRLAAGDLSAAGTWDEMAGVMDAVREHLDPIEVSYLFERPLGSWDAAARRDVHWLIEAQGVLRYALGEVDTLCPLDVTVRPGALGPGPLLAPSSYIDAARLRDDEALARVESLYSFVLSRATAGPFRGKRLLPPHVKEAVDLAVDRGLLSRTDLLEDDVAAFGLPVFRLEEEALELLTSIATERCRAGRWLLGWDESFYRVSLDTRMLLDN